MAKSALLIGINQYPILGRELRGCVHDAHQMQEVLKGLGFPRSRIAVLVDREATKRRILTALRSMVSGTRSGDVVVVYFAGLGSNVPDRSGDEADYRDEIICPADLDWRDPLTVESLQLELEQAAPGVNSTLILDCCHSGPNTRAAPADAESTPRFFLSPWDLIAVESGRSLSGTLRNLRTLDDDDERNTVAVAVSEIVFTACDPAETAVESHSNSETSGVFTRCLANAITKSSGEITYRELLTDVRRRIRKEGFRQSPNLLGSDEHFDLPFLAPFSQS